MVISLGEVSQAVEGPQLITAGTAASKTGPAAIDNLKESIT